MSVSLTQVSCQNNHRCSSAQVRLLWTCSQRDMHEGPPPFCFHMLRLCFCFLPASACPILFLLFTHAFLTTADDEAHSHDENDRPAHYRHQQSNAKSLVIWSRDTWKRCVALSKDLTEILQSTKFAIKTNKNDYGRSSIKNNVMAVVLSQTGR